MSKRKLDDESARLIVELKRDGIDVEQLSELFDVCSSTIYSVLNGISWTRATKPLGIQPRRVSTNRRKPKRGEDNIRSKLSNKDVLEIVELLKQKKLTQTQIGDRYGVSQMAVCFINTGRCWAHITGIGRDDVR